MNYNSKVVDIVALIYESIAYDDVWHDVINNISDMLGADCGNLVIIDRKNQQLSHIRTGPNQAGQEHYIESISAVEEARLSDDLLTVGAIRKGSELNAAPGSAHSPIFEQLFKQHDVVFSLCSCFYRDAHYLAYIEFSNGPAKADFDNASKKLLGVFIPHLTRAFSISLKAKLSQLQAQIQNQLKHTTDTALFLVLAKNSARPMNGKAHELIEGASILSLSNDRLLFRHPPTNKRFQELVRLCILTAQGEDVFPGGFIRLESHDSGQGEWHIGVTPYRKAVGERELWKAKGALVIVRSVEKDSFARLNAVLGDFYGLTASETQVLMKMISGLSSSEIADELQLTKECVRSRLKKIYQKTGASNQVQLTHDILKGPYKISNMLGQT